MKLTMKRRSNQSGFSLMEVLSSMTVFAVAASGMLGSTMSTIKTNSVSRHTTAASALIQDKIEELRALNPTTSPADFTTGVHQDANNPMTALGATGGAYRRSWNVVNNSPVIGMAEVLVTVSWNGANGTRSLQAATFICKTATCS